LFYFFLVIVDETTNNIMYTAQFKFLEDIALEQLLLIVNL